MVKTERPEELAVLRRLRSQHPDTPVVVEVPTPTAVRHTDVLEGCTVLAMPATRTTLLRAVAASARVSTRGREAWLVADGDAITCERCGDEHIVFTINGEPRTQAVRCGAQVLPVGRENERFTKQQLPTD